MPTSDTCQMCGKKFNGLFKNADLPTEEMIRFFAQRGEDVQNTCQICCCKKKALLQNEADSHINEVKNQIENKIREILPSIQCVTIPLSIDNDIEIKGMVSGYSVIGTGPFTEIASAWTDFWGQESGAYFDKIRLGETRAMNIAKLEAIKSGANMIIGANINVSEATKGNGMLIISCVGTAVRCGDLSDDEKLLSNLYTEMENFNREKAQLAADGTY